MRCLSSGRILFVDFDGRNRSSDSLLELLVDSGIDVLLVRERATLFLELLAWSPQVVVIDGDPPGIDYVALEDSIRAVARVGVATVFMSRRPRPEGLCSWVISKPTDPSEFLSVIRSALASRRPSLRRPVQSTRS